MKKCCPSWPNLTRDIHAIDKMKKYKVILVGKIISCHFLYLLIAQPSFLSTLSSLLQIVEYEILIFVHTC